MATILDKDIIRESSIKFDEREVQVTLTADQRIEFKLKGMKGGMLGIGIEELYKQLRGDVVEKRESISIKQKDKTYDEQMISLSRLRNMSLVTHMDRVVKLELEKVICELLNKKIEL